MDRFDDLNPERFQQKKDEFYAIILGGCTVQMVILVGLVAIVGTLAHFGYIRLLP